MVLLEWVKETWFGARVYGGKLPLCIFHIHNSNLQL